MKRFSTIHGARSAFQIVIASALAMVAPLGAGRAWAGNLTVAGDLTVNSNMTVSGNLTATGTNTMTVGTDGKVVISTVHGYGDMFGISLISSNAFPRIAFDTANADGGGFNFYNGSECRGSLWVSSDDQWLQNSLPGFRSLSTIETFGDLSVYRALFVGDDAQIEGKLIAMGGIDPPYLLLDAETRATVAQRVAREVPPSKQTGAVLYWNSAAKQLEIYVANEGAFYNLTGNLITNITPPKVANATVTKTLRVDRATGEVVTNESVQAPHWRLKSGCQFDRLTGVFTRLIDSNAPPVVVTREEALELK